MAWDLAITRDRDLIFSAGRDFEYVEGSALINQRIQTRVKIVRGSWLFDEDGTLGSRLDLILSEDLIEGEANIEGLIREALDPIRDEIDIQDISTSTNVLGRISATITYLWLTPDVAPRMQEITQLAVII
jgi:hypothetical protein